MAHASDVCDVRSRSLGLDEGVAHFHALEDPTST